MAYNPRSLDEDKSLVPVIKKFMKPNGIRKDGKREYYMEWWQLGDPETAIAVGTFHSSHIKAFVKMFMGFKKYIVIFLRREHDQKILWDKRSGNRQV